MPFLNKVRRRLCGVQHETVADEKPLPEVPEGQPNQYPIYPPPHPRDLIDNRNDRWATLRKRRYAAPIGEKEDKPLYVLYRLYEYILLGRNIGMRNEIEAFWWTRFPVSEIPDPEDEADQSVTRSSLASLGCWSRLSIRRLRWGSAVERTRSCLTRSEPHGPRVRRCWRRCLLGRRKFLRSRRCCISLITWRGRRSWKLWMM
jgi:hypothetical protein